MAEAVLLPIAKSTLQQLSSPALKEFLLLWNSEKELKKLETTVETITLVLQDAEKRQSSDHLVRGWLARLRAVMYDAEDLFDGVTAAALRKKAMTGNAFEKEVHLFFSKSNQLGFIFKTAHEVKAIRESLDDISRDMGQFHFISNQPVEKPIKLLDREATHSSIQAKDVIGRDQERDDIIKMLLPEDIGEKSNHQLGVSVVAVIGFGGLGKTTLAQHVYNDERVVNGGFDLRLWVCINYLSDLEQVLIEIIGSVEEKPSNLSLEKLTEKLGKIIAGKKFLVVLDDVWDENELNWLRLKPLLDYGNRGSKVLVTTRSNTVARCMDAPNHYRLGVLSEEYAWSLFVKMAFDEGELSKHPELEPFGRQVIDRCGRVPLALAVVGRILRHRDKDERTWLLFLDNELGEVLANDDKNKIMQVLMVSYNDLPSPLKHCFASCSLFPKNYRFDKDELIRLWLGQGFIRPSKNNLSMEEVGESYFFHLVDRCFFQEVKEKVIILDKTLNTYVPYGNTAKVHDLLHDLALYVVGTESKLVTASDDLMNGNNIRHISISSKLAYHSFGRVVKALDPKTLRTFLLPDKGIHLYSPRFLLPRFKMLRTLDVSGSVIAKLPDSIGELIHLRYLNLSGMCCLDHLPSSICCLSRLMILELRGCRKLEKLPSDIGKLVSLRQLLLDGCHSLAFFPSELAALTSLVNLDLVIVHCHDGGLRYLNGLSNLSGILKIKLPGEGWSNAVEDTIESNMSGKNKLHGMFIHWDENIRGSFTKSKREANSVLDALEPHKYIKYLNMLNFSGDNLSSWVRTHHIKELCLHKCDVEYIEVKRNFDIMSFPSLEILELKWLCNLKGWWRIENDDSISRPSRLSNVVKVVIEHCPELTRRMPLFGNVETLVINDAHVKLVRELLDIPNANYTSLSSLYPYQRLKVLSLKEIKGLHYLLEGWIGHLTALQTFEVHSCPDFSRVPGRAFDHLTSLEILELHYGVFVDGSEVGMPWKALKRLRLLDCTVTYRHFKEGLQYLTSLETLCIKILKPDGGEEGRVEFPLIALQKLRSLRISFGGRAKLSLANGMQYLRYLKELIIKDCEELYLSWTAVLFTIKLDCLLFYGVRRVINVDDVVLQQQNHLRMLSIDAEVVHDMPWKLLGSLQVLQLSNMGEMEQLPVGIQHLTSLQRLWLEECSVELAHRCEEASGEDWHLICHVPETYIEPRKESGYTTTARDECDLESSDDSDLIEETRQTGWCGLTKLIRNS